jgi:hypothetical protein
MANWTPEERAQYHQVGVGPACQHVLPKMVAPRLSGGRRRMVTTAQRNWREHAAAARAHHVCACLCRGPTHGPGRTHVAARALT